jgi:flagellar hook assembly protein FlgD
LTPFYNVTGQFVRTLKIGRQDSGEYVSISKAAHWDGRNDAGERVASGVYFYRIQAGDFTDTRKLAVSK